MFETEWQSKKNTPNDAVDVDLGSVRVRKRLGKLCSS